MYMSYKCIKNYSKDISDVDIIKVISVYLTYIFCGIVNGLENG
jgi:hypothetical protein